MRTLFIYSSVKLRNTPADKAVGPGSDKKVLRESKELTKRKLIDSIKNERLRQHVDGKENNRPSFF